MTPLSKTTWWLAGGRPARIPGPVSSWPDASSLPANRSRSPPSPLPPRPVTILGTARALAEAREEELLAGDEDSERNDDSEVSCEANHGSAGGSSDVDRQAKVDEPFWKRVRRKVEDNVGEEEGEGEAEVGGLEVEETQEGVKSSEEVRKEQDDLLILAFKAAVKRKLQPNKVLKMKYFLFCMRTFLLLQLTFLCCRIK